MKYYRLIGERGVIIECSDKSIQVYGPRNDSETLFLYNLDVYKTINWVKKDYPVEEISEKEAFLEIL
jgi:hypothetical protein